MCVWTLTHNREANSSSKDNKCILTKFTQNHEKICNYSSLIHCFVVSNLLPLFIHSQARSTAAVLSLQLIRGIRAKFECCLQTVANNSCILCLLNCQLFFQLIIWSVKCHKKVKKILKAQGDICKCVILSKQPSKTTKYEVYSHIKNGETANPQIREGPELFGIVA